MENKINNIKTPYYIIDKKELNKNYESLFKALKENWNNIIIGYSYKTNSLPWIIQFFNEKCCYSEVVSDDEYKLGKLLNVDKNRFIYNGPIKTIDTFIEAANNGCYINIDSKRELEWALKLDNQSNIGLRVNFDIEKYCVGQSQCGNEGGRFGFCYENGELKKAIEYLKENGINISGIHLHVSSKTRSLDIYKAISDFAVKIINEYKLNLKYIDIGGGFFGGLSNKPQFDDYIKIIAKSLKNVVSPENTTLIVEPGISLIGSPIYYVSSVIDVKDTTYNRFVVTDGTRNSLDPLMNKNEYFHRYNYCSENRKILDKQVICGYTCMEHDRLYIEKNNCELKVGDKIIYEKVGAYTMCLTPLFIKYFPDVYIYDNNNIEQVRKKWSANEYIQKSLIGGSFNEYINN